MATPELQVINAVLKNKDVGVLYGPSVDDLFVAYGDAWQGVKQYHQKYHELPDIEVIQEKYPEVEEVSVKGPTEHYLSELKTNFLRGRVENVLLKAGQTLNEDNAMFVLNKLQESLSRLNRFSDTARAANIMDFEDAERYYQEVREKAEAMGGTPGIPTGISFLDSAYPSGFAGGDLIVTLGWTGRGKSLFTTLVGCNAHDNGHKPMIVSLEMSAQKVRDRVYTIKGSGLFKNSDLTLGDVDGRDFAKFRSQYDAAPDFLVVTNDGVQE